MIKEIVFKEATSQECQEFMSQVIFDDHGRATNIEWYDEVNDEGWKEDDDDNG